MTVEFREHIARRMAEAVFRENKRQCSIKINDDPAEPDHWSKIELREFVERSWRLWLIDADVAIAEIKHARIQAMKDARDFIFKIGVDATRAGALEAVNACIVANGGTP
jgi:hypothetical protein